jgi:Methyltransferase domain.
MEKLYTTIFGDLPRQGPGEAESTLRALEAIPDSYKQGTILDIGCGTGSQTLLLLANTSAKIIALDSNEKFVKTLLSHAQSQGYDDRINGMVESMQSIRLPNGSVDVIWCEGAIYHVTPEQGLSRWKSLLKPKGFFAFTDLCWMSENPPKRILNYWRANYPKMLSFDEISMVVERCGYNLISRFTLSPSAWKDNYYTHLENMLKKMEDEERGTNATELFEAIREEMVLYEEYGEYYNYGFFIAQAR